jgi:hypothetical protein
LQDVNNTGCNLKGCQTLPVYKIHTSASLLNGLLAGKIETADLPGRLTYSNRVTFIHTGRFWQNQFLEAFEIGTKYIYLKKEEFFRNLTCFDTSERMSGDDLHCRSWY